MAVQLAEKVGTFFYVINPNTTAFQSVEEVPNYINDAIPFFVLFIFIEWVIIWAKGEGSFRIGDTITSNAHGITMETAKLLTKGIELIGYQWLYNQRLVDLDWSSPVTWWAAAIGIDFCYYWFHRFVHEVNIAWASHQVHHSSEDYNLTTALRQSVFQKYFSIGFYQPLALLGVPLPAILVHNQFNLLYQFWIHTEIVDKCGPLEWIFNTPSHHRVHHGSNKWALDKNYAGVLIIWDRMFGTFEPEHEDEAVVYGLVDQPQTFNAMWLQVFYFRDVFRKFSKMETVGDKLRALFYGPGWTPGSPRLGDLSGLPDKWPQRTKYDPQLAVWQQVYIVVHYLVVVIVQQVLVQKLGEFSYITAFLFMMFIFVSIGTIGGMFDGWWWAPVLEAGRCIAYVAYAKTTVVTGIPQLDVVLLWYMAMSTLIWSSQSLNVIQAWATNEKLEKKCQ